MDLTSEQRVMMESLDKDIQTWYKHAWETAQSQIAFHQSNPEFVNWIVLQMTPSIMRGDEGFSRCLQSIQSEHDPVLRYTKFLAAQSIWNEFQAPPNDVAQNLKSQGWDEHMISAHLTQRLARPMRGLVADVAPKDFEAPSQMLH